MMTMLEMKLTLSERLTKKAQATGLLNPKAIEGMLREAVAKTVLDAIIVKSQVASTLERVGKPTAKGKKSVRERVKT